MSAAAPEGLRIAHVCQPVDGGAAQVLRDLVAYQATTSWDVTVLCPESDLAASLRGLGVNHRPWNASRSPRDGLLAEAAALRRALRAIDPDVVHLHSSKAGLVGRLVLRGRKPTVFQPHGWSYNTIDKTASVALRWERLASRWTQLLLCVSEAELEDGRRNGIACPAEVVTNGVDVDRFAPADRQAARERLAAPDAPVALCLGRLAPEKGQDLLLQAWRQVHAEVPSAQLWLVGDGPSRSTWQASAGDMHSSVRWFGATDEPPTFYAAADVIVLPSRTEGMALVPLEAMACARSIVAFDVGGSKESVGDAGAVVSRGDVTGLAQAITARLTDPVLRRSEGLRGRDRAVRLFASHLSAAATSEATSRLVLNSRASS